jgi:tripartite-type tricarboxylate transporter receptor subunit TctC
MLLHNARHPKFCALLALAAGCLAAGPRSADAQKDAAANYPERAIRIIVSVPAGGGVDTVTRLVGQRLQQRLGQPVIVENRAGAAGNIGAEAVANAAPDGYTLLATAPSALAVNAALYKNLKYDPDAFEPVAVMASSPNVLVVRPDLPVNSTQELIAFAKANPRKLTYASQGSGTTSHLTAELFQKLTGTQLLHVPYRGTAPALNDLVAGHVDLMFVDLAAVLPLQQAGKTRLLAIASRQRETNLAEVPTFQQAGVTGLFSAAWNAIAAPPKTPESITSRLNTEINAILNLPEVEAHFRELNLTRVGGSRADMAEFVSAERQRWEEVVRSANVTLK